MNFERPKITRKYRKPHPLRVPLNDVVDLAQYATKTAPSEVLLAELENDHRSKLAELKAKQVQAQKNLESLIKAESKAREEVDRRELDVETARKNALIAQHKLRETVTLLQEEQIIQDNLADAARKFEREYAQKRADLERQKMSETEERALEVAENAVVPEVIRIPNEDSTKGGAHETTLGSPLYLQNSVNEVYPKNDDENLPIDMTLHNAAKKAGPTETLAEWHRLPTFDVDLQAVYENGKSTPELDDVRAAILRLMKENNWFRLAVTSAKHESGKSITAARLAIALAEKDGKRTVLLDCDLREPRLHREMNVEPRSDLGDLLRGKVSGAANLVRLADRMSGRGKVAFAFNGTPEPDAAALLRATETEDALDLLEDELELDMMIFNLPPVLAYEDTTAMQPLYEAVLLVIDESTSEQEIAETKRVLGGNIPVLEIVTSKTGETAAEV